MFERYFLKSTQTGPKKANKTRGRAKYVYNFAWQRILIYVGVNVYDGGFGLMFMTGGSCIVVDFLFLSKFLLDCVLLVYHQPRSQAFSSMRGRGGCIIYCNTCVDASTLVVSMFI